MVRLLLLLERVLLFNEGDFSGEITDAAEDFYAAEPISTVESILAG